MNEVRNKIDIYKILSHWYQRKYSSCSKDRWIVMWRNPSLVCFFGGIHFSIEAVQISASMLDHILNHDVSSFTKAISFKE